MNSQGSSGDLDGAETRSRSSPQSATQDSDGSDLQQILAQGLLGGSGLSQDQISSYYQQQQQHNSAGHRNNHEQYSVSLHAHRGQQSVSASY